VSSLAAELKWCTKVFNHHSNRKQMQQVIDSWVNTNRNTVNKETGFLQFYQVNIWSEQLYSPTLTESS